MKRIEAEWQSYKTMVVPPDAEEVQLKETRKAFYAGAVGLFDILMSQQGAGEQHYFQLLDDIKEELEQFKNMITQGII